jgi:hypothetical protein
MWYEDPSVAAVGVTLAAGLAVAVTLDHPLRAILAEYAGSRTRGRFWAAIAQVVLTLVPVTTVLLVVRVPESPQPFSLSAAADVAKWGLVGLTGSVVALAGVIGLFGRVHGATIFVDPDQADDLQRLLVKVQELRARELLGRLPTDDRHAPR